MKTMEFTQVNRNKRDKFKTTFLPKKKTKTNEK